MSGALYQCCAVQGQAVVALEEYPPQTLETLAAWAREGRFKSDARAVDMCVRPVHEQLDGCPDPGCVDLEGLLRTVARDGDSEGADPVVINTVPPPDYEYAA